MNTNLAINTSKIRGYKNAFYAVSLILIFAISIVMTFAPNASAQIQSGYGKNAVRSYTTNGYISVAPLLLGVGQTATVNAWVFPLPVDYNYGAWYSGPAGGSYTGISVTFTKPDGTKDTLTPTDGVGTYPAGVMDALGTMYFYYTPNMAGNWSATMTMPAQNFTNPTGTVMYSACTSNTYQFTVQTAAVNAGILNGWPYSPLPNSNVYWRYPVSSNNREWSKISGEWLSKSLFPVGGGCGGNYNPYTTAVATGHVLWDTQTYMGGIIGGAQGSISYQGAANNVAATVTHVIMEGKLYVDQATSNNQFECFDLATGKLLYTATGIITAGIHLPGNAYAQAISARGNVATETVLASSYGTSPTGFLFGTTSGKATAAGLPTINWNYYNPVTGQLQTTITNVTATTYDFIDGTSLAYGATYVNESASTWTYQYNYIFEWNLTRVVGGDWWTGIMWTHTINNPAKGVLGPFDGTGRGTFSISADLSTIVCGGSQGDALADGFSATDGHSLWNDTLGYISMNDASNDFLFNTNYWIGVKEETNTIYCYSMLTGAQVWTTPLSTSGNDVWTTKAHYATLLNDANNYYISSPNGQIIALDIASGKIVWTSTPIPTTEMAFNALPFWDNAVEGGGLIYAYAGYAIAYELNPIPRFAALVCINATTGATVWVLNGGIIPEAIADGCLTGYSQLSGMIYTLGKGQTSTSVSAPTTTVAEGTTALIQGNVLDQSPAQPGTPAVSDSSMNQWMDYLNMQNSTLLNTPPTPTGVQVTLTAVDPNNNTITIGSTTTDSTGTFGYSFVPSTSGIYKITATFAGSGSYWPSTAQTRIAVTAAAPVSTSTTTTTSSGISETTLYTAVAAIIIVIIIAVAAAVLVLRKRP